MKVTDLSLRFVLARAFINENASVLRCDNNTWILKFFLEILMEMSTSFCLSDVPEVFTESKNS